MLKRKNVKQTCSKKNTALKSSFIDCTSLIQITIPQMRENISKGCYEIKEISIPSLLTPIEDLALCKCVLLNCQNEY